MISTLILAEISTPEIRDFFTKADRGCRQFFGDMAYFADLTNLDPDLSPENEGVSIRIEEVGRFADLVGWLAFNGYKVIRHPYWIKSSPVLEIVRNNEVEKPFHFYSIQEVKRNNLFDASELIRTLP